LSIFAKITLKIILKQLSQ